MSIFEDPLEIHYNAETRITGVRHLKTLSTALDRVAAPSRDVAIVLDWDSLDAIAAPLPVDWDRPDHIPAEHVELRPDKIGYALETKATIHGVGTNMDFGIVMVPRAVRYDNSVANHDKVVAIDFEEVS